MEKKCLFIYSYLLTMILPIAFFSVKAKAKLGTHLFTQYPKLNRPWSKVTSQNRDNINLLVEVLKKSKTGQLLLKKAMDKLSPRGKTLLDIIAPSEVSYLDTTLIRKFKAQDPNSERYHYQSQIYLGRSLFPHQAILDLVHELTHFVFRRPFNPYKDDLSPSQFIRSAVEGRGGEVHAYLVECSVFKELFFPKTPLPLRCKELYDSKTGGFSKAKAISQFYQIGGHYRDFSLELEKKGVAKADLPLLAARRALFLSSTHGLPYPIAVYREFQMAMKNSCQNDSRRIERLKRELEKDRFDFRENHLAILEFQRKFEKRCSLL